jgi:hypothetical protein
MRRCACMDQEARTQPARPTDRRPIDSLIEAGWLDPGVTALVWTLIEGRLPLLVIGRASSDHRRQLRDALVAMLDEDERPVEIDIDAPEPSLGVVLRGAFLGTGMAEGLAMTLEADSLADLMVRAAAPPRGLAEDEVRALGVVVVVTPVGPDGTPRLVAAHLLRRVERDAKGHLQRRPPAVLATWDPAVDRFEDFAWAIVPEIADRLGVERSELEERLAERTARLAQDAAAGAPGRDRGH